MSDAKVETVDFIQTGDIVTAGKDDYFVEESFRGSLKLIRIRDMREGFRLPLTSAVKGRKATDAERGKFYDFLTARLDAAAAYRPGALVKPNKASKHVDTNKIYVIIKASPKTVSIIELGGNINHSYTTAPRPLLDIVDPADVLK